MPNRPLINSRIVRRANRIVRPIQTRPGNNNTVVANAPELAPGTGQQAVAASGYNTTITNAPPLAPGTGQQAAGAFGGSDDTYIEDTSAPSGPEEDQLTYNDFESAEDVFIGVDRPSLSLPLDIKQVDQFGFIVKGSVIRFREYADAGQRRIERRIDELSADRFIYIVKLQFNADSISGDRDIETDTVIADYAGIFDGRDVSYSTESDALTYDESEESALRRKFSRTNITNAAYENLLNSDFNYSNIIEPPLVRTIEPEPITINNFSSLSNPTGNNVGSEITISPFAPTPGSPRTSRSTGGGY